DLLDRTSARRNERSTRMFSIRRLFNRSALIGLVGLAAACSSSGSTGATSPSPSGTTGSHHHHSHPPATTSAIPPQSPAPVESNPPGDIPDSTRFLPYHSQNGGFVVKVPEGWSRT